MARARFFYCYMTTFLFSFSKRPDEPYPIDVQHQPLNDDVDTRPSLDHCSAKPSPSFFTWGQRTTIRLLHRQGM